MRVKELLDQIEKIIESSWSLPLSGGKTVVDAERVVQILEEIRIQLPQEIKQAEAVVADRARIISEAKKEADAIVKVAEERSRMLINQSEIVKKAQTRANDMIEKSQLKSREMRQAANEYVDELMKRADEMLTSNLSDIRKTRQNLKISQKTILKDENKDSLNGDKD